MINLLIQLLLTPLKLAWMVVKVIFVLAFLMTRMY